MKTKNNENEKGVESSTPFFICQKTVDSFAPPVLNNF